MIKSKSTREVFFELLKSGLWESDAMLLPYGKVDYEELLQLATEQSVIGLVSAGLEHVIDVKVPQEWALQFAGQTLVIEQRNCELNEFVTKLYKKLQSANIYTLVIKGQGLAQNYERPLWRASGDVDLLLDSSNYEKAKETLFRIAYDIQPEDLRTKHQAMKIMGVDVELHGMMPFLPSEKVEKVIDKVVDDSLHNGGVSKWDVSDTEVYIPNPNNHLYIVFTHFLHHFFIEGVGLRQICDWCRLLWKYRTEIDVHLLESRLNEAGLMTEWKAFASLAASYLGMPPENMPFYDEHFNHKGEKVLKLIFKTGNFGHNKDLSYRIKFKGYKYKIVSFNRRFVDFVRLSFIFPLDGPRFFAKYVLGKVE